MSNQVAKLETEVEQTRAALAANIDELLHRANPKTIAAREVETVKSKFVDLESGEPRTENILVAVGAVVGVAVLFAVLRKLSK